MSTKGNLIRKRVSDRRCLFDQKTIAPNQFSISVSFISETTINETTINETTINETTINETKTEFILNTNRNGAEQISAVSINK